MSFLGYHLGTRRHLCTPAHAHVLPRAHAHPHPMYTCAYEMINYVQSFAKAYAHLRIIHTYMYNYLAVDPHRICPPHKHTQPRLMYVYIYLCLGNFPCTRGCTEANTHTHTYAFCAYAAAHTSLTQIYPLARMARSRRSQTCTLTRISRIQKHIYTLVWKANPDKAHARTFAFAQANTTLACIQYISACTLSRISQIQIRIHTRLGNCPGNAHARTFGIRTTRKHDTHTSIHQRMHTLSCISRIQIRIHSRLRSYKPRRSKCIVACDKRTHRNSHTRTSIPMH